MIPIEILEFLMKYFSIFRKNEKSSFPCAAPVLGAGPIISHGGSGDGLAALCAEIDRLTHIVVPGDSGAQPPRNN